MIRKYSTHRGHEIYQTEDGKLYFADTNEPTVGNWKDRPCGHCGLDYTPEDHDGCLGTLPDPDIMNACCGHGEFGCAYVQFWNSPRLGGDAAVDYIEGVLGRPMPKKETKNEDIS